MGRVVVAVPAGWRSIENPFCQRPPTNTVVYFNPLNLAGSCPYLGAPRGPEPSYLQIEPHGRVTRADHRGTHEVPLGGEVGLAWNHPHSRYGQSAGLLLPREHVTLFINTPRARLAHRILASATEVPAGYRVIPKPTYASRRLDAMMTKLRGRSFRVRYAEESPGHTEYGYPGRFIRTDPPIGSALPRGSTLTAYFSNGRLSAWVSTRRLASQGWSVAPAAAFTPPVDRSHALHKLGLGPNERAAFLREVTVHGRTRLAWLVVVKPHYGYPGGPVTISVLDARTGKVWADNVSIPATA